MRSDQANLDMQAFTDRQSIQQKIIRGASWAVGVLCLAVTLYVWHYQALDVEGRITRRFAHRIEHVQPAILNRLVSYQDALRGLQGLFIASASIDRKAWRRYIAALHLDQRYPGITALGFIAHVPREELAAFEASIRADGMPRFQVQSAGEGDTYFPVT